MDYNFYAGQSTDQNIISSAQKREERHFLKKETQEFPIFHFDKEKNAIHYMKRELKNSKDGKLTKMALLRAEKTYPDIKDNQFFLECVLLTQDMDIISHYIDIKNYCYCYDLIVGAKINVEPVLVHICSLFREPLAAFELKDKLSSTSRYEEIDPNKDMMFGFMLSDIYKGNCKSIVPYLRRVPSCLVWVFLRMAYERIYITDRSFSMMLSACEQSEKQGIDMLAHCLNFLIEEGSKMILLKFGANVFRLGVKSTPSMLNNVLQSLPSAEVSNMFLDAMYHQRTDQKSGLVKLHYLPVRLSVQKYVWTLFVNHFCKKQKDKEFYIERRFRTPYHNWQVSYHIAMFYNTGNLKVFDLLSKQMIIGRSLLENFSNFITSPLVIALSMDDEECDDDDDDAEREKRDDEEEDEEDEEEEEEDDENKLLFI